MSIEQFLMTELLRQGPSYILIALACDMDPKEVEVTIKKSPSLRSAYRMAVADIALKVRQYSGNKSRIAQKCNVPRHIVDQWIRENRALQVEVNNAEEKFVDLAEAAMLKAIRQGKDWAVLHTLETKGASRGWAKTRQIDLRAFAQATNVDVRSIVGDVVTAIASGDIDADVEIVED
jgi:hypothetical protein